MKLCERARFALLGNSISWRSFSSSSSFRDQRLYQRLSPVGDPNASVVPILDQWVLEGNPVDQIDLQKIIRELRSYKRFNHALQISQWMSDKRYMALSAKDMAARLDLISRVHGIDKAQEYFENIPVKVKRFEVHAALLCAYAREGFAEKAEALMDRIRDELKFHSALCHNVMMSLYSRLGEHEKLDSVVSEMERDGIAFDVYSYSILLGSRASLSDAEGMTRIVKEVESNHVSALDWEFYSTAANGFIKVGSMNKAYEMLKKLENHLWKTKKRALGFYFLLGAYGQIGNKDELYHVWDIFKRHNKIYNKGYSKMMSSLLELGDVEGAERVFREWEESTGLSYDHSIPDLLIGAYCGKGLPGKARELVEKQEAKGVRFELDLWTVLAGRYLENGLVHWAIGALKKAIPVTTEPTNEALSGCLEYLEGDIGDIKGAEKLVELLSNRGVFSESAHERFLDHVKKAEKQVMSK